MKAAGALAVAGGLFLGLLAVLPAWTRVRYIDEPSVNTVLPDRAGPWQGRRILYCQNPRHGVSYFADEYSAGDPCPECGAQLGLMSHIETVLLPADTRLDRMEYRHTDDMIRLTAAMVLSGRDRASIHRPEVCLVGDGSEIVVQQRRLIPLDKRPPLKTTVLTIRTRRQTNEGLVNLHYFYCYWFAGRGRETPSHVNRMFWMAWDRVLRGRAYPWAYISVAGVLPPMAEESVLRKLDDLVRHLYPLLQTNAAPAASGP